MQRNRSMNHRLCRSMLVGVIIALGFAPPLKADLLGSLYQVFGGAGRSACNIAADGLALAPLPACSAQDILRSPLNLFCRFTRSDCAAAYDQGEAIVDTFETTVSDIGQQGMTTIGECLQALEQCPQELMQQLNSATLRLQGRIKDEQLQPVMGVMVTAVPVTPDPLLAAASTHIAVSDIDGNWVIDINPAFSYRGDYRVSATGAVHDFFAINNMPRVDYVVTVE